MKKDWFENIMRDSYPDDVVSKEHQDLLWQKIEAKRNRRKRKGIFSIPGKYFLLLFLFISVVAWLINNTLNNRHLNTDKLISENIDSTYNSTAITHDTPINEFPRFNHELKVRHEQMKVLENSSLHTSQLSEKEKIARHQDQASAHIQNYQIKNTPLINDNLNSNNKSANYSSAIIKSDDRRLAIQLSASTQQQMVSIEKEIPNDPYGIPSSYLHRLNSSIIRATKKDPLPTYVDIAHNTFKKYPSLELGFDAGIGVSSNTLTAINNELLNHIKNRNESETNRHTIFYGLTIRKFIKPSFYIQSGLIYNQHKFRFNDQYEKTFYEERDDLVVEVLESADGTLTNVIGPGSVKITESTVVQNRNYLRTLSIPIYVGYRTQLKRTINFNTAIGLQYGFLTWTKGFTHAVNGAEGEYQQLSEIGYKKTNPISAIAKLSIQKDINTNLVLEGGIGMAIDVTSRSKMLGISDKYQNYFLNIGFLYRLY